MNSYILSRQWFDFAFENPALVNPNHGAIYAWLIELANRLGWPPEFANPATQAMAATGIKSYNTYKKAFDELVGFGFVEIRQTAKNQFTACIIALSIFNKALDKALDKAIAGSDFRPINNIQSTGESTCESIYDINKPQTTNHKPNTRASNNDLVETSGIWKQVFRESEYLTTDVPFEILPPENQNKNSTPGGGARKMKFAQAFPTLESFLAAFAGSEWEQKNLNLPYYYTRHTNYSESQNVLQSNWFLTCCNWFAEDELKNKLIFNKPNQAAPESQISKRANTASAAMDILNRTRKDGNE